VVFKEKVPLKNKRLVAWQEEEKLQHSFEEAIKDIQQKEPPKDLHGANIRTLVKANLRIRWYRIYQLYQIYRNNQKFFNFGGYHSAIIGE
jgi:hypothetical protein